MKTRRIALAIALLVALPATAEARASLALSLSATTVTWGSSVTVSGAATPPVADQPVTVTVGGVPVGFTATAGDGTFSVRFEAHRSGPVLAQVMGAGATTTPTILTVAPRIVVHVSGRHAWYGTRVRVTVRPSTWKGILTAHVTRRGLPVGGVVAAAVRGGHATFRVSSPAIGRFGLTITAPPLGELGPRTVSASFTTQARTLAAGASGPDVRELLRRLEALGFHTPGITDTLSRDAADSIMAFQKAYRLPRTYVFDAADWRRLMHPHTLHARHRGHGTHIEIDKTRQVLMIVRGGRVASVIAVSTGATGNTPEGTWHVLWRAQTTRALMGTATLYWTMTFHGNFAIHGFDPVPPFPASHGCTREPIWASGWVYQHSSVGETVYVYR
jgi:hypothetical protein